jgi:hypothetical protein
VTNSDLVEKFKTGAVLNHIKYCKDKAKVYHNYLYGDHTAGAIGYTDLSVYEPNQE